jgi:hypothetical protein
MVVGGIETNMRRGTWIDPREGDLSLASLASQWLGSNLAKRPDTRTTDEYHLNSHILPSLGNKRIAEVTPRTLQHLANSWTATLAPKPVSRSYLLLAVIDHRWPDGSRTDRARPERRHLHGAAI